MTRSCQERENDINIIRTFMFFLSVWERTISTQNLQQNHCYSWKLFGHWGLQGEPRFCLYCVIPLPVSRLYCVIALPVSTCCKWNGQGQGNVVKNKGAVLLERAVLGPSWGGEHPQLGQGPSVLSCALPAQYGWHVWGRGWRLHAGGISTKVVSAHGWDRHTGGHG